MCFTQRCEQNSVRTSESVKNGVHQTWVVQFVIDITMTMSMTFSLTLLLTLLLTIIGIYVESLAYMSGGMMSYLAATFTTGSFLNNHLVLSVRHKISIVETCDSYA